MHYVGCVVSGMSVLGVCTVECVFVEYLCVVCTQCSVCAWKVVCVWCVHVAVCV